MLNTRELEKRWLKYKIKSYLPYSIIVISLIIISTILFVFFIKTNEQNLKAPIVQKRTPQPIVKKTILHHQIEQNSSTIQRTSPIEVKTHKTIKTAIIAEPLRKSNQLTLKPSMGFIKHIQNEDQQPYYQTLHTSPPKRRKKEHKKRKIIQQKNTIQEEYMDIQQKQTLRREKRTIKKETAPKKSIITIERRDSQKDIKDIIKRFEKSNSPALSLFVAKKSYEIGDYEQAYNYALITNGINNDIEESWLIFAKALVKLHKKNMAIKTLREYIKYSHSGNAKILLNDIKSGNFQ